MSGALSLPAAETTSEEPGEVTRLPTFVVTEVPEDLPWKYLRAGEFEVLSLCSDSLTWAFIRSQYLGRLFFPELLQSERSSPATIILFGRGAASTPPVRRVAHDPKRWGAGWHYPNVITVSDRDSLVIVANLEQRLEYEPVSPIYVRQLILERAPAAPPWLLEGLFGHYGIYPEVEGINASWVGNLIRQPSMLWVSDTVTDEIRYRLSYTPEFEPLDRLFASPPSAAAGDKDRLPLWASEAGLFVRWQLYADRAAAKDPRAFWAFALNSSVAPVTEQMFRAHFHLGYEEAKGEMLSYLRRAVRGPIRIDIPEPTDLGSVLYRTGLRPATAGEIARLKGNWERLEARELAASAPDLAEKYQAAARRTLRRGCKLGAQNDPAFLAVLGLHEAEVGQVEAARTHLEAAAAAGTAGTQALLAVARLRLAEIQRETASENGLAVAQLESVLTPLFAARARSPVNPDVYRMIADAWARSQPSPTRGHLNVLLEGVRLFPGDSELLWQAADLHRKHGYFAEAKMLAAEGVRTTSDPAMRPRFTALELALANAR